MVAGTIDGMTVKLTISLPDELAEAARRAVRLGLAESVSGYIAAAIDDYERRPTLQQWLDQYHDEFGPPTEEEREWARQQLLRVGIIQPEERARTKSA